MIRTDWIPAVLALPNPYDYEAFLAECKRRDIQPLTLKDYTTELGKLLTGKKLHPSYSDMLAYQTMSGNPPMKKSCCGGGGSIK